VLLVVGDNPFPPRHGGTIAAAATLRALLTLGHRVHVLVAGNVHPEKDRIPKDVNVSYLPRRSSFWAAANWHSYQVSSRIALRDWVPPITFDAIILEGAYVWHSIENVQLRNIPTIYRSHNDETRFFLNNSVSETNILKKLFFAAEAIRIWPEQHYLTNNCSAVAFISDSERARLSPKNSLSFHIPAYRKPEDTDNTPSMRSGVLFAASLSLSTNRNSLLWYLKNVHQKLTHIPGYELTVAGRATDPMLFQRKEYSLPKVRYVLSPVDMAPYLDSALVFINPALDAAGVKMKVFDAIDHGVPVVSTSRGLEGSGLKPGDHALVADNPDKFAKAVDSLLRDPLLRKSIVACAREKLARDHDTSELWGHLLSMVCRD
jgi:polysaccharide biosynthesis protein PslH